MRVGMVCYPTFGGSGVVATELGKALAKKGHEVHFITYDQPVRLGSFRPNVYYHEVRISKYPLFDYPPYELVLASKMVEVARQQKLDLLHVHYAIPHASSAYTAKQILKHSGVHLPVITTLHGTDITLLGKDPSFEPVISFAINQSDAVTAVSSSLRSDTYKLFGINRDIEVIPNFICPKHFVNLGSAHNRSEFAREDEALVCHVSNFRPVKRVEDVIRTFALVAEKRPARLLMVGDGPDRPAAERLAREMDIADRITFLGKLKNPLEALAIADLFLLPSESESFGLAALEALACGVPVVATEAGGLPEVIRHGVSGMMAPVGDVERMADDAAFLLSPENHDKFRKQALKRASAFHIDVILPHYLKAYERILSHQATT
ncbi:MAG: N-acetyl-alpha-D-glucosaminyl L-malate synthase BshA [Crocinitomicaceae bacterium]|nr:N-acetyl-alpha-D-glucosaminyl L-malate synthase BshA [Crocinitomicaceae bacterium]